MRTIMVLNAKGGCGKSTLSTSLAAYYALQGKRVMLADFDPQGSSLAWLAARPGDAATITGINGLRDGLRHARSAEYLILDTPAGATGSELTALVRRAQTILIPVLPSATDMRAAARFVHELLVVGRVERKQTRLATIANRVPQAGATEGALEQMLEGTPVAFETTATRLYRPLERFLERLHIPFIAQLRDSPNYALADGQGLSIFEVGGSGIQHDRAQWQPLLAWLESRRSLPHPA